MYKKSHFLEFIDVSKSPIRFPTLCGCIVCGGIRGFYKDKQYDDKELAYQIAIIQHGYYLKIWEGQNVTNKELFPKKCTCECAHEFDEKNVGRCLHEWKCKKCDWVGIVDSSD